MTPHRNHGKGTYQLDREFPGVGRVRRASGTMNGNTFTAINNMLSTLWAHGRSDVLAAIRDRRVHPMDIYGQFRRDGITGLKPAEQLDPVSILVQWIDTFDGSDQHRRDMRSGVKQLLKCAKAGDTLGEVAAVMRRYKKVAKPSMFRHVRFYVQALLRENLGERHAVYHDIKGIKLKRGHKAKTRPPIPLLVLQGLTLEQPLTGMAWSMALTGMGPKEYWGAWEVLSDRVVIHGTKQEHRERIVPRLGAIVVPGTTADFFRKAFKKATDYTPYQLRHTFGHWLEMAGVPHSRVKIYMGHESRTVTETYLWHEIEPFLNSDAETVLDYLEGARRLRVSP